MIRSGFTFVELLVVLAIIAVTAGMVVGTTWRRDETRSLVKGAALELAATLRQARSYAMDRNIVAGLSFHIENAPGSSGKTLNNRSGGHWYRILGAARGGNNSYGYIFKDSALPLPQCGVKSGQYTLGNATMQPIRYYLDAVESAWIGDRHVLPTRKVRFLAIGDQDNGHRYRYDDRYQPTGRDYFYPRPWFGRWDATTKTLHPWGGYDPEYADFANANPFSNFKAARTHASGAVASCTAFFYEGKDGPITGCVNPVDRVVVDDSNGDFLWSQSGLVADPLPTVSGYKLWAKDEARPLINAAWLDVCLLFRPDGSVQWLEPFPMRRTWGEYAQGTVTFTEAANNIQYQAAGDRCTRIDTWDYGYLDVGLSPRSTAMQLKTMWGISNYPHTGAWYITMGPDVPQDDGRDRGKFASSAEAIASMMPMYRISVTPSGIVDVFEVKPQLPGDPVTWHPSVSAAKWQDLTFLQASYGNGSLMDANGLPTGRPVVDFLVPAMLDDANWWMQ